MKEKQLQSLLTSYLRKGTKNFRYSFVYELKIKHNNKPLNIKSDLQPQQIPSLIKARTKCLHKKLSDMDPSLKPFDALQLCNVPAFLICCWYTPHKPKILYWMDPIKIQQTIDTKHIKSIKPHEAIDYALYISIL